MNSLSLFSFFELWWIVFVGTKIKLHVQVNIIKKQERRMQEEEQDKNGRKVGPKHRNFLRWIIPT